ncbi:VOC family protein [Zafaria sp. Z1313]|uniref:VOC family protein n=1 Tax=unclassified Zafaria TaxID=2828765 RepID=UPI002E795B03|nr:VOC family protein [Zafaria sp. J156]MEE1621304.1 VOC family protein [Zafaria sp. J156]
MGFHLQTTVDSADPHAQAEWWAETLGWSVEPTEEAFIRRMIEEGHAGEDDTRVFKGQLVWKDGAAICPTEQLGQKPRQRILFQLVPEPKTVKNRVHWDINLTEADTDKESLRTGLEARGARFLYEAHQGPFTWFTMADPEGNEFCFG